MFKYLELFFDLCLISCAVLYNAYSIQFNISEGKILDTFLLTLSSGILLVLYFIIVLHDESTKFSKSQYAS